MSRAIILLIFTLLSAMYSIVAIYFGTSTTIIHSINRLPLIFSPIPITYSLLIVVYIGLIYFCVKAIKQPLSLIQVLLFIVNALLQIVAVYYFYNDMSMLALLALVMQVIGLFVMYITFPLTKQQLLTRLPIAAWYSWTVYFTLIAFNYNMIIYEWNGFNLTDALWAVILLTIGAAFALHLRYHYYDRLAPTLFIIGYAGIILNNGFNQLFVSSAALFLMGVMIVGIFFIKKKKALT